MPQFTEDNLQRIMINPFYAITFASRLTEEHELSMSETEWVQANALLIQDIGAEQWLKQLLDELEGKTTTADERINPFHALNIDPMFSLEHPPIIGRDMWVDVNVLQIRNMGTEGWLRQLLDVLNGDIVKSEEVDLASPPGGPFGYSASSKYHVQRWGKHKRKKKRKQ